MRKITTSISDQHTSIIKGDEITFEFEDFLERHEESLPTGLDSQYMAYIPYIENPFRNILRLPKAIVNLPMNAIFYQDWRVVSYLYSFLIILGLPTFATIIITSVFTQKTPVGITLVVFIFLGLTASVVYLKLIYTTLDNLVESRKAPWLVEKIQKPFEDSYQRPWNSTIFYISMIIALGVDIVISFKYITDFFGPQDFATSGSSLILIGILMAVGYFGLVLMLYLSILTYWYIIKNTQIYDKVLQPIIDRVIGYTEGQESILSKKNYEVVGVLSDTPGLSIRSLGDIPVLGLGAGIFLVNSTLFLIFSPVLIHGVVADFLQQTAQTAIANGRTVDPFGLNYLILAGIILSALASFGAVLYPLVRITRVMAKFKGKALTELDPFLFDEITGVALRQDTVITNETQVLFMIRSYIYSMKVSPVNPFRLIYIVLIAIVYGWRGLPVLLSLITTAGGG